MKGLRLLSTTIACAAMIVSWLWPCAFFVPASTTAVEARAEVRGPMSSSQASIPPGYALSAQLGVRQGALSDATTGRLALSADGTTLLAGAPERSVAGHERAGAADVFRFGGQSWGQPTRLSLGPKAQSGDALGATAALSGDGNTVLLASFRQMVVAFSYHNGGWGRPVDLKLQPRGGVFYPWVDAVALNGNGRTALVGMATKSVRGVAEAGVAEVFRLRGTHWTGPTTLTWPGFRCRFFGASVALDSDADSAIVGAPYCGKRAGGIWSENNGAAEVFQLRHGKWLPSNELTGSGGYGYGWLVALGADGHVALLGADSVNGAEAFVFSGRSWSGPAMLRPVRSTTSCSLSIGLSGDGLTATLGVPCDDGGPLAAMYHLDNAGWTETARLPNAEGLPIFGNEVALSGDAGTVAVLAGASTPALSDGVVDVFRRVQGAT